SVVIRNGPPLPDAPIEARPAREGGTAGGQADGVESARPDRVVEDGDPVAGDDGADEDGAAEDRTAEGDARDERASEESAGDENGDELDGDRAEPDARAPLGRVRVTVIPFGDVMVDGRARGASPLTLSLPPGEHVVMG